MRKCSVLWAIALMICVPALNAFGVVIMTRDVTGLDESGYFVPGTTSLDIAVTMTQDDADNITAFSFTESLPAGWTFNSIVSGPQVDLPPAPGASGDIGFAFIATPARPFTVTYRVDIPAVTTIPVDLSGYAEYRTQGPALHSTNDPSCVPVPPVPNTAPPTCPTVTTFELEPTVLTIDRVIDPASTGLFADDPNYYVPGGFLDMTITFTKTGPENLSGLAFTDNVPTGWTISNITASTAPGGSPANGSTGTLEFFWITPPPLPATLSYRINIPAESVGDGLLSGQSEYRTGGPAIFSNVEATTLQQVPCLTVDRPQPPNPIAYVAGNNLTISVEIGGTCTGVSALSLTEQIPPGWAFVSVGATNQPSFPPAGTENELEFFWITIPTIPFTFTYTVSVPPGETGTQTITGQSEYRLGGPALFSIPTSIDFLDTDVTPPVITLTGDATVTVECGDTYTDAGATATDDFDGDITGNIVTTGLPINTGIVGVQTITYNVSDAEGNAAIEVTRSVEVVDTVAPVITLNGSAALTIECGAGYTDAGATASDSCSGNLTGAILVSGSVNPNAPGDYTLTFNVSDGAGNAAAPVTRTVTVADTTAPVITLNGPATVTVECATAYTDAGATATDTCDGGLTPTAAGTVNTAVPGAYTITFNVSDAAGNAATQRTRTVNVVDNTAPVITRNGPATLTINQGSAYAEQGATVTDACDATVAVVIGGDTVNTAIPGTYVVTYNAEDDSGNAATQVTRSVTVVDVTPPVIALNGANPVTVECGSAFADPGATATDNTDGNITGDIVVTGTVGSAVGVYTLTYNVSDDAGNAALAVTRTVNVVDTTVPTITLSGDAAVTVECGATYNDAGATASDTCDATVAVTVAGSVDTTIPGSYTLTYSASDDEGNAAVDVTRTVTVSDTTAPVIALNGDAAVTVECGGSYTDAGASATDTCDSSVDVVSAGTVDTAVPGTYTITYNATDDEGNAAVEVTRTVTVSDTVVPVVTITGGNTLTVDCDSTFTNPEATATDSCDGDVEISAVLGTVDTTTPGTYPVTYEARDAAGNTGSSVLTVTVSDNCDPDEVCTIESIEITSPEEAISIPAGLGTTTVVLRSEVVLADIVECSGAEVTVDYTVNGAAAGSSTFGPNYEVALSLGEGTYEVVAVASLDGSDVTATDTFTFVITACQDVDNNGIIDSPFDGECLVNEGSLWIATVPGENCSRQIAMRTWFGDGNGGTLVLTAQNPEDENQTVTIRVPRNLLAVGEQGVVILSIACDLPSLLGVDAAAAVGEPDADLAAGAAYFDITILVTSDGGATFGELDNSLVDALPIEISLSGLNITPGLLPSFVSHETAATDVPVAIVDEEGEWDSDSIFGAVFGAGTLTASTSSLSVFAPAQVNPVGPTISISPNPAFEVLFGIATTTETVTKTLTVSNIGTGTVAGTVALTDPSGVFAITAGANYSLAAGASQNVTVTFSPDAAGDFTGTLTFAGGDNGPISVTIKGSGSTLLKETSFLGCAPAPGATGSAMGDLAVLLLAGLSLLAGSTLVRRTRTES